LPKLPSVADIGTKFKDTIMGAARTVFIVGGVVLGVIIIGPRLPGMAAKFTEGSVALGKQLGKGAKEAYNSGQNSAKDKVAKGIEKLE